MSKSPWVLIFFNFLSFFNFNFSTKLKLFFNSLIGKIGFVIKVGSKISFSHGGAHFQAQSAM